MLEIHDAAVAYGGVTAFSGFNLDLAQSEMVSIIGLSGCGKTSLLYAIMGLVPLASGKIFIPQGGGSCGLVFQQDRLLPWKTALDNILLGLNVSAKQEALALLDLIGLGKKATTYPSQLSGGERQRVALARTLVRRPQVLLLDEPLASLDEQTRETLQDEIKAYVLSRGITTLMVTHSIQEAVFMGQRIVVMSKTGIVCEVANGHHGEAGLREKADFFKMERTLRAALGGKR